MEMEKSDPKKLSVNLGGFSCQIEGFDDPMSVLREVTAHMRELSNSEAAFLAQPKGAVARPGQTIQVQPRGQITKPTATIAQTVDGGEEPARTRDSTAKVLRGISGSGDENAPAQPSKAIARSRTDASIDLVDAPEEVSEELKDEDRVDDSALTARMAQLVRSKSVPDAKSFIEKMKAEKPSEKFEAGAAFLIHFQGYRNVTPKQVNRLLKRAEAVDEGGLANLDELIAGLMKTGRIGGNMQEGLCLGGQSPYSSERIQP